MTTITETAAPETVANLIEQLRQAQADVDRQAEVLAEVKGQLDRVVGRQNIVWLAALADSEVVDALKTQAQARHDCDVAADLLARVPTLERLPPEALDGLIDLSRVPEDHLQALESLAQSDKVFDRLMAAQPGYRANQEEIDRNERLHQQAWQDLAAAAAVRDELCQRILRLALVD